MQYTDVFNAKYIEIANRQTVYPKFKVQMLDIFENVSYEVTNDISKDSSGSISVNYQQGVRRSVNLSFIDKDGQYFDSFLNQGSWALQKFKLLIGLLDVFTDDIYWFSQGVFYITSFSASRSLSSKTVTISGVDKFGIFGQQTGYNQLEATYLIPEGTKIYSAIKDILTIDVGNGFSIDPKEPILDPYFIDEVTPYDITKSPGSYMSDILIELAYVLGASIFYDVNGHLNIVRGTTDFSYSGQPSMWEFSDVMPEYMNPNLSIDVVNFINAVRVVGTNVNDKIYEYTAENNNPSSPTRVELIGRKIHYIETAMAYDEERAKEYAEYKLNELSVLQSSISFESTILPHLDVDEVVDVDDKYYKYIKKRFIIQSLSIPISTSDTMQITACDVATLPYWEG